MQKVIIPARTTHTSTVIFLHGIGDTPYGGWKEIFSSIQRREEDLWSVRFILPAAKHIPVSKFDNAIMPAWNNTYISTEIEDTEGIQETVSQIRSIIEEEINIGIPSHRIILGGFSQGGHIALYTGLTHEKSLAGVCALCTYLLQRTSFDELMRVSPNYRTPLLMCHGTSDNVVVYSRGVDSFHHILEQVKKRTNSTNHLIFKSFQDIGHTVSDQIEKELVSFLLYVTKTN